MTQLLDAGADINARMRGGVTALLLAAGESSVGTLFLCGGTLLCVGVCVFVCVNATARAGNGLADIASILLDRAYRGTSLIRNTHPQATVWRTSRPSYSTGARTRMSRTRAGPPPPPSLSLSLSLHLSLAFALALALALARSLSLSLSLSLSRARAQNLIWRLLEPGT